MIPLSAWVSLSAGALLIGLEYIAAAAVTAAANICAVLTLSTPVHGTLHAFVAYRWLSFPADVANLSGVT